MDINPVMSKFGFGHRSAKHIIIDHEGELWLAMAPVAIGGFLAMGMAGTPGVLRIEPLENGEAAPFNYTATESILKLETKNGAKAEFTIDKNTQAIRIKGNCAFRLNGVVAGMRGSTLNAPEGVTISSGGARYFITAPKGSISFDDSYILGEFRNVTPVLEVEPESGEFELCVYDLPADTEAPAITKTLEECAAENAAEFSAFVESLVDVPAEWADVKEKIAYPLWLCHRFMTSEYEVVVGNKYNDKNTDARLMSIASMAFKDARRAVDMILAYPADMPPVAAVAALRLLDENMLNDSRGEIYRVYQTLEAIARKCMTARTTDQDGLSYYAYRFESGCKTAPAFFDAGEPVLAPDLNAYLVLVSEVIGRLAKMEYDTGIGVKWEARAKELLVKLVAELWDGENFIGKNAYSGEVSGPDDFLSLIPIILGKRLPEEIRAKLAAKIDAGACGSAVGFLLAGGLYDAGEEAAAADIARKALGTVRSDGIECPFYGASLLALAHKVL